MVRLPGSVLFACTLNAIRSPMAEALLKHFHGSRIYVQSVGVRTSALDPFAVVVMDEMGIDISRHRRRSFDDLEDDSFDLIISLSPEVYSIDYVPFAPRIVDGAWVALFTVLVSFVATLYPSWSAARILPAEALRYE